MAVSYEQMAEMIVLLKAFAGAVNRIDYYNGVDVQGNLYLDDRGSKKHTFTELLDGIDGQPLTTRHLRRCQKLYKELTRG